MRLPEHLEARAPLPNYQQPPSFAWLLAFPICFLFASIAIISWRTPW